MNDEFGLRRQRLMAAIGPESIAVVPSASETIRNSDVHHHFRQNSDFYYLTGFEEPDAILFLVPGFNEGDAILFLRPRDLAKEQWDGRRLGVERACDELGVDKAYSIVDLQEIAPTLFVDREELHTNLGEWNAFDSELTSWLKAAREKRLNPPDNLIHLSRTLHEMRLIKSDTELACMQKAANISIDAHQRAMRFARPGISEQRLESEMIHEFSCGGARHTAYPSIVASGANACIMHYVENSRVMQDGDLVLIDAGCEINQYASDITRTFPVNGSYSAEQRALYEVVLAAQLAAIEAIKPGAQFIDPHEIAEKVLTQGLVDLKILNVSKTEALERKLALPFLVHRCSHWLGLDVHDVGANIDQGKSRRLEPGMVLTVEPGIYIKSSTEATDVDCRWHGIGIRIEDDVCVTADGHHVLSGELPKTVAAVEQIVNG